MSSTAPSIVQLASPSTLAMQLITFLLLASLVTAVIADDYARINDYDDDNAWKSASVPRDRPTSELLPPFDYQPLGDDAQWCPQAKPGTPCLDIRPFCEPFCSNSPYCVPTCDTSENGPAWAGGGQDPSYMLFCPDAIYANCHYSGAPYPTGTDPNNIALPCELQTGSTVAHCKCEVASGPNWVNLTAIMNLGAYHETIAACGEDGSRCVNMNQCPTGQEVACYTGKIAPVCQYVAHQNPEDPSVSLIPGADLISTYGLTMSGRYQTTDTPTCSNISSAGCMTAPCYYTDANRDYAQCECPTTFQKTIQLNQAGVACDLPAGYVWE